MKVLPAYVFVGLRKRAGKASRIESSIEDSEIRVYANDKEEVVIVQHKSHLERLLRLTSDLEEIFEFENVYLGCELQIDSHHRRHMEPVNLLFVSPRGNMSLSVLEGRMGGAFDRVFRMFGEEWILLYSRTLSVRQYPILRVVRKFIRREITGLSEISERCPPPTRREKSNRYDPIRARTRELGYQLTQARAFIAKELYHISDYAGRLQSSQITVLNHRLRFFKNALEAENAAIEAAITIQKPSYRATEGYRFVLNRFESLIDALRLDPSSQQINRERLGASSQLLESVEILSVEDAFVLDAYDSLRLKGLCPIIIPSKDNRCRVVKIHDKMRIIELPITLGPRLGLLPIVYHLAAHVIAEETARTVLSHSPNLKKEIEIMFTNDNGNNHERSCNNANLAAREISADLLSAEVAGPAYFYALSRAFPFEKTLGSDGYHELKKRLGIVFSFLCKRGFRLRLDALPMKDKEILNTSFDSFNVSELVPDLQPRLVYSKNIHESMLANVKPALFEGEVCPFRPSLTANALWDAVLNGKEYLNENAAFLSVLKWIRQRETYRPR